MKSHILAALLSVAALGACVDQADDSVTADPRLATNGLVPSAIHANALNTKPLTGAAISADTTMVDTYQHALFTQYIVECALSSTQTVTATYGKAVYNFTGSIGLVPAWTTRDLTDEESRAVSACVLARANLTGTNVTISLRGDSGVLGTTVDEAKNYNVEEAAFYGDLFTTTPGAMHACNGVDQVRVGDTYGDLPLRQCGQPDSRNPGYTLCGFVYDGECAKICEKVGDHYTTCQDANGDWLKYGETVRLLGTAP
jgi:hypothetical protein